MIGLLQPYQAIMGPGGQLQSFAPSAADAFQLQQHLAAGQMVAAAGQSTGAATAALLPAMQAAAQAGTTGHQMHHHHHVQAAQLQQLQPSATAALFVAAANIGADCDLKDLFTRYADCRQSVANYDCVCM